MSNKTNLSVDLSNTAIVPLDRYNHMLQTLGELRLKSEQEAELINNLQTSIYKQEEQIIMLLHKEVERLLETFSVKKENICIMKQTTGLAFLDSDIAELLSDYHENIQNKVWELIKNYGSDVDQ